MLSRPRILLTVLFCGAVLFVGLSGASAAVDVDRTVNETTALQDSETALVSEDIDDDGAVLVLVNMATDAGTAMATDRRERGAEVSVEQLQARASTSQTNLERFAMQVEGITVEETFWLTNMATVTVDTDRVRPDVLARVAGVESVVANTPVRLATGDLDSSPGSESSQASSGRPETAPDSAGASGSSTAVPGGSVTAGNPVLDSARPFLLPETRLPDLSSGVDTRQVTPDYQTTYGLSQIDATEVWDTYGTRGENTSVAVLDTGVDPTHPDIDLADFAYFALNNGTANESVEPQDFDPNGHGTHVSGTVSGGNASGEQIGVAPNTTLYNAAVIPDCTEDECIGFPAQVVGGMEWAVENDADVVSMSLGFNSEEELFIDAVRNARAAGTSVVVSSMNEGERTSGTPANVYDSIAVGASNEQEEITDFSSGERVDTDMFWTNWPADWPSEYVVPTVSAPGDSVKSSLPGDDYGWYQGTSMAAPHVSGAIALVESSTGGNFTPAEIEIALERTARKPAGALEPAGERDIRYGSGIIDVPAAIEFLTNDPTAAFRYRDPRPAPGQAVTFDGNHSIGNLTSYEWEFSDGTNTTNASGALVNQTFESEGEYDVTLTVTGPENTTDSVTRTVTVQKPSVAEQWTYDLESLSQSSVTVVNLTGAAPSNVTDGQVAVFGSNDGTVHTVDAETGEEYWTAETGGFIPGSPTVVDETVYVGSFDGAVHAYDAKTGDVRWTRSIGPAVTSSPTATAISTGGSPVSGTVFVGSNDDHVYALDAETGDVNWRFETGDQVRTSPTVVNETVYVGSDDGTMYALNATPEWENGTYNDNDERWGFDTSDPIRSSPTVANGTVFFGSDDSRLYAVNASNGDQIYQEFVGGEVRASPTTYEGTVFVASTNENVYAFDATTGVQQWEFVTGDSVLSSPTVVGERVLVGSSDRRIYGIDAESGAIDWRFFTDGSVETAPTIVNGTAYFGSYDEHIYALDVRFPTGTGLAPANVSSQGSRVMLGTLGHHDSWADQEVVGPPRVAGEDWPRDLDVDGRYEDVRGSGDLSVFDVQTLFDNLDNPAVQNNAPYYDFQGGGGSVSVFDVQSLFQSIGA